MFELRLYSDMSSWNSGGDKFRYRIAETILLNNIPALISASDKKIDRNDAIWNNEFNLLPFIRNDGPLARGIVPAV